MERRTSLTEEINGITHLRGYALTELLTKASFVDVIFTLLIGRKPEVNESRVFSAVLVTAIDHGLLAPSADVARRVAAAGSPLQSAVGAGVSAIGDWHGGAVSQAAELFQSAGALSVQMTPAAAQHVVTVGLHKYQRLPGFGHRVYEVDPRVKPLFDLSRQQNIAIDMIELALAVEGELAKVKGKKICLNIDGALAAVLSGLHFPPLLQRGVFIIARTPGLVAQVYEQITTEPPIIRSQDEVKYIGQPPRSWS